MLEVVDNKICRLATHNPLWQMQETHTNLSDIRHILQIPPLSSAINYRKAAYLAHTMRRDNDWLPKLAITGRFLPDFVDTVDIDITEYFWVEGHGCGNDASHSSSGG